MAAVDAGARVRLPASSEVDDFTDQVDEACRLIAGLQTGSISPEDFDRQEAVKVKEAALQEAQHQQSQKTVSPEEEAERQHHLKQKIAELQNNRQRKAKARQRYDAHVSQQHHLHMTDYTKWDLFTPDDEEDDLINSLTPNNPQMKALEADIDARHARMVSQRQLAERQRVEGNALYAQGQYSAAFQCYETGLDAERHNMALHGNAAQVLIKMGCCVQAIEHCDKVMHLAEFLHNRPSDPLCAKALWRRAAARKELKHYSEAVKDLQQALDLEPNNKTFAKELDRLQQDCTEQRKQRAVLKQLDNGNSLSQNPHVSVSAKQPVAQQKGDTLVSAGGVKNLQVLQNLVASLQTAGQNLERDVSAKAKAPSGLGKSLPVPANKSSVQAIQNQVAELCTQTAAILHADEDCRVYLRECAGLASVCHLLSRDLGVACSPVLHALTAACQNNYNCKAVAKQDVASLAARLLFNNSNEVVFDAVCLLYTLTTESEARLAVGQALVKTAGSGGSVAVDQLFAIVTGRDAGSQAMALSLLSNCVTQPAVLKAVSTGGGGEGQLAVVATTKLLSSQDLTLSTKAATLLGNLCHDSTLRTQITSSRAGVASLLAILSRHSRKLGSSGPQAHQSAAPVKQPPGIQTSSAGSGGSETDTPRGMPTSLGTDRLQPQGSSASKEATMAAATALQNLLLDKDAQLLVADLQGIPTVAELLTPDNWILAARASGILARLAQQPQNHAQMLSSGAIDDLLQLLAATMCRVSGSDDCAWHTQIQDSAARLLATLSASSQAAVLHIAQGVGLDLLLQLLRSPACSSAALGNISLCIGDLAKQPALLPTLQQKDAVAPLLNVAYKCQGSTQKNAAIAVARLAHNEACMKRVKELHGFDIIYQYVRP